ATFQALRLNVGECTTRTLVFCFVGSVCLRCLGVSALEFHHPIRAQWSATNPIEHRCADTRCAADRVNDTCISGTSYRVVLILPCRRATSVSATGLRVKIGPLERHLRILRSVDI